MRQYFSRLRESMNVEMGVLRDSKESSLIGEQYCHRTVVKVEAEVEIEQ